jgi:hypothetical protein
MTWTKNSYKHALASRGIKFKKQLNLHSPLEVSHWSYKYIPGILQTKSDLFFGPKGCMYLDYGDQEYIIEISSKAKIAIMPSAITFLEQQGLLDTNAIDEKGMSYNETYRELVDVEYDYGIRIIQSKIKNLLKPLGYDGVYYYKEQETAEKQYQIWNKNILTLKEIKPQLAPEEHYQLQKMKNYGEPLNA